MAGTYARYSSDGGGSGGGGIASINGNSTPAQVITAGTGVSVVSSGGTTTITNTSPSSGGTVTSVSVTTNQGVSGSVATPTTTPNITLSLGDITPTQADVSGSLTATGLAAIGTSSTTSTAQLNVTGSSSLGSVASMIQAGGTIPASLNVTCFAFESSFTTTPSGHLSNLLPFVAQVPTLSAGSSVTNYVGFLSNQVTIATNNSMFSDSAPSGNWAINIGSTLPNTLGGTLVTGGGSSSGQLTVNSSSSQTNGLSVIGNSSNTNAVNITGSTNTVALNINGTFNNSAINIQNTVNEGTSFGVQSSMTAADGSNITNLINFVAQVPTLGSGASVHGYSGFLSNPTTIGTNNALFSDGLSFSGSWGLNLQTSQPSYIAGTLTTAKTLEVGPGSFGGSNASTIGVFDSNQNSETLVNVVNTNSGSSASARLGVTSNAGSVTLQADSTGSDSTAYLAVDSGFTGGLVITQSGVNPINFNTNGTTGLSISGSQAVTIGSGTTTQHTLNTQLGTPGTGVATITNLPGGLSSVSPSYIQITINGVTGYIPFFS